MQVKQECGNRECFYMGRNGRCSIVSGTVLERLCPSGKKKVLLPAKVTQNPQATVN